MLGVLSFGSEFGFGTLKTLFAQGPGRLRVFGAKLVALAIALVPFVLVVYAVGLSRARPSPCSEGTDLSAPSDAARRPRARRRLVGPGRVGGPRRAACGAARGTALAMGVGILYALVIEGLLSALASEVPLRRPPSSSSSCGPMPTPWRDGSACRPKRRGERARLLLRPVRRRGAGRARAGGIRRGFRRIAGWCPAAARRGLAPRSQPPAERMRAWPPSSTSRPGSGSGGSGIPTGRPSSTGRRRSRRPASRRGGRGGARPAAPPARRRPRYGRGSTRGRRPWSPCSKPDHVRNVNVVMSATARARSARAYFSRRRARKPS